ncbi:MAG: hypothetical protein K2N78_10005 [Oscillospiraceae bacterium]|nr:hypothetical protein [Oscillospiraceae bacterium]
MQQAHDQSRTSGAPDETGYFMPQTPGPGSDSWIYGEPGQVQNASMVPSMGTSSAPIQGMNGGDRLGGISSAAAQSQRMKNPVSMADTHMPPNSETAYQASLRSLLDRNIGYFVVATFMTSPNQPITWQGILHSVGSDYVVLYQPDYERYVSGDLYSLKFVQFHNVKGVPYCAASSNWQGV